MKFLNSFLGIAGIIQIVAVGVFVVLWIMAIYGAFTRKDLKNNRWLWIVILLFVAPIGAIAYFFAENRKKYGVIALILVLFFILVIPVLYTLIRFSAQSALTR